MRKFNSADKEAIHKIVEVYGNDGHSVYTAKSLVETGIAPEMLPRFIRSFKSDESSPTSTIFGNDGAVIRETLGVYGLQVLEAIVIDLGLKMSDKMGRGWRARDATEQIKAWLER